MTKWIWYIKDWSVTEDTFIWEVEISKYKTEEYEMVHWIWYVDKILLKKIDEIQRERFNKKVCKNVEQKKISKSSNKIWMTKMSDVHEWFKWTFLEHTPLRKVFVYHDFSFDFIGSILRKTKIFEKYHWKINIYYPWWWSKRSEDKYDYIQFQPNDWSGSDLYRKDGVYAFCCDGYIDWQFWQTWILSCEDARKMCEFTEEEKEFFKELNLSKEEIDVLIS